MKRIVLAVLAASLIGACGLIPTPNNPQPTAIIESPTVAPALTDTAQPTVTLAPVTETFTSTPETPELNPSITPELSESATATPTAFDAVTDTPSPIAFPNSVTPSPTNGVLTHGTLPPAVPFNTIGLWNKSKAEAYISLQQQDGKQAIIEYPVKGKIYVDVPLGSYIYVAWVGGKKMTGSFNVGSNSNITIYLYQDRIAIEK